MDYLAILGKLKDYYANLLIVQYNGKPKATATIKTLVDLIYTNMILMQIRDGFDWKTAVGVQLDIIGKWVGVTRDYIGSAYWGKEYFSYPSYDTLTSAAAVDSLQHGYSDYETFDSVEGNVLTYKDLETNGATLQDDDYRVVIGLKIIKNSINHIAGEIDKAIYEYFGGKVNTVWSSHTLTYNYSPELENIMNICLSKNVLPAPTGVEIVINRGI